VRAGDTVEQKGAVRDEKNMRAHSIRTWHRTKPPSRARTRRYSLLREMIFPAAAFRPCFVCNGGEKFAVRPNLSSPASAAQRSEVKGTQVVGTFAMGEENRRRENQLRGRGSITAWVPLDLAFARKALTLAGDDKLG
jgi:hypothetical protein